MTSSKNIESIKTEINTRLLKNYDKINYSFENPYNWSLLDSIRIEICFCIFFDLSQAAITLTNHLLEKTLKAFLILKENSVQNFTDAKEIEQHYEQMNSKYGSLNLHDTINLCKSKALITEQESKDLHEFREKFRNSFSHADPSKIFGDTTKEIGIFNPYVHDKIQKAEVKVANFQFVQDVVQKQIADKECIPYFKYVDTLIRRIMSSSSQ